MIHFFNGKPLATIALIVSVAAQSILANESETLGFEGYVIEAEPKNLTSSKVDLSSHPRARMFRTRLGRGAEKGANFAGHYALVSWGCGSECQGSLVVDLTSGKVLGVEGESEELQIARGSISVQIAAC